MERPLERVVIVGSGNLAEALAQAVARSGLQLVQLFARNAARGEAVAALAGTQWTADPARLADADIEISQMGSAAGKSRAIYAADFFRMWTGCLSDRRNTHFTEAIQ